VKLISTSEEDEPMKYAAKDQRHEGPDSIDWSRVRVVDGRGLKTGRRHTLASLRVALGKTQVEVADRAGMGQGDVSTLERRGDSKLSTLARYASALGGNVEVAVVIDGRRYLLDVGEASRAR
jgi:hypothetical protein